MSTYRLGNGPIVLTVSAIKEVDGQFGEQWMFTGVDPNGDEWDLYISAMTAARQLARLNLTQESTAGKTLAFEQVKKDGKTYTNIEVKHGGAGASKPAASAAPVARVQRSVEELSGIYGQCVAAAIQQLHGQCDDRGIPVDGAAIQSAAATLFIAYNK